MRRRARARRSWLHTGSRVSQLAGTGKGPSPEAKARPYLHRGDVKKGSMAMGSCLPPPSTCCIWGQDEHIWLSPAAPRLGLRAGMKGRINGNRCGSLLLLEGSLSFLGHPLLPQPLHGPNVHTGSSSPEHRSMLDWSNPVVTAPFKPRAGAKGNKREEESPPQPPLVPTITKTYLWMMDKETNDGAAKRLRGAKTLKWHQQRAPTTAAVPLPSVLIPSKVGGTSWQVWATLSHPRRGQETLPEGTRVRPKKNRKHSTEGVH